jgi:hypothetical protein
LVVDRFSSLLALLCLLILDDGVHWKTEPWMRHVQEPEDKSKFWHGDFKRLHSGTATAYPSQALLISILMCHSATKSGRRVATARSQDETVQDTRMNLISSSEMRTKLWLARRRRPVGRDLPGAVRVAQARNTLHFCKCTVLDWFHPHGLKRQASSSM